MATFSLQLLKCPNSKEDVLPCGRRAYIALKSHADIELRCKSGRETVKFSVISPECVTLSEIEYESDRLIQELKIIRKQARIFFKKNK